MKFYKTKGHIVSAMRFKTLIVLGYLFGISGISLSTLHAQNVLQGTVNMPNTKRSLSLGPAQYVPEQVGLSPAERAEVEALVHPDQNVYIILHPLNFTPELTPSSNIVITQKAQTFIPLVQAITVGSTIYLLNEDNDYHNVYSRTPKAAFNIGRRPTGHVYPQIIEKVGVIKLFCDIHAHMKAFVLSLDTPYFSKVLPDGSYELANVPDGSYELEVFHVNKQIKGKKLVLSGGKVFTEYIDLSM